MSYNFTEEEVLAEVRKEFDEEVCLDLLSEAREAKTLEDAALMIIVDSALWNGTL